MRTAGPEALGWPAGDGIEVGDGGLSYVIGFRSSWPILKVLWLRRNPFLGRI